MQRQPHALYTLVVSNSKHITPHIEQAIRDAIEKGDYLPMHGDDAFFDSDIPSTFLDPLFWQALGKARGWTKKLPSNFLSLPDRDEWEYHWHRFIDHLAKGKDAESFFAELLGK